MTFRPHAAEEGLLSWVERWAPGDAEVWSRWRRSLPKRTRADALLPLQAALAGVVAFRHLENHPAARLAGDFRPHIHALRATYGWALSLTHALGARGEPEGTSPAVAPVLREPETSLWALERSLTESLQVADHLLRARLVDGNAFYASCDHFLRELEPNVFFRPPDPLEFSNVEELIGPAHLSAELTSWTSDAAKTTSIVAFLALLRSHRVLGIADRQIGDVDGLYRAHVAVSAVRRELRMLTRFLLVQGVAASDDEEAVERLAMVIHSQARSVLDDPLPGVEGPRGFALPAERMRNGIRELRTTLKRAAIDLRQLSVPASLRDPRRKSERIERDLRQDIWAFRFILRGFLAKASAASLSIDRGRNPDHLEFAGEFVRHFRAFGPRLVKGTRYPRRGALTRAVTAMSRREAIDAEKLADAMRECALLLEHLDRVIDDASGSPMAPFDKQRAAAELRDYLSASRSRSHVGRAPQGAFGASRHAEAG